MVSAATVHRYLDDVDYPCDKPQLVEHARRRGAPEQVVDALRGLPLGPYDRDTDVTKGLDPAGG